MPNYRVAITVILDPVEAESSDVASHKALEFVQNALYGDTSMAHVPEELSKAVGDGTGELDCMIRGAVLSEKSDK